MSLKDKILDFELVSQRSLESLKPISDEFVRLVLQQQPEDVLLTDESLLNDFLGLGVEDDFGEDISHPADYEQAWFQVVQARILENFGVRIERPRVVVLHILLQIAAYQEAAPRH